MKHHHCDRCGTVIEGSVNTVSVGPPYSFYQKKWELCRECRKALESWLVGAERKEKP